MVPIPNQNQKQTPGLRLKDTRQSEAVRELLSRTSGVPYHPSMKLLGGSSVGTKEAYQLNQVSELLERTIVK